MQALTAVEADKLYIRYLPLAEAMAAASRAIEDLPQYDNYVITTDDVVVTQKAFDAVVAASTPTRISTGWCPLDEGSDLVNICKSPLGEAPTVDAYDFFPRAEVESHPQDPVPTHLVGMGLTCIPRGLVAQLLPLECFHLPGGKGFSSDFHLSKKCERIGIPMVAPKAGYIHHVKERWNELDQAHEKRLLIGEVEPSVTLISATAIYKEVVMTDRIATEDIIEKNDLGQNVVVVAAGQPIPADVDVPKSKTEAAPAEEPATEDKAVRSSRSRKRK